MLNCPRHFGTKHIVPKYLGSEVSVHLLYYFPISRFMRTADLQNIHWVNRFTSFILDSMIDLVIIIIITSAIIVNDMISMAWVGTGIAIYSLLCQIKYYHWFTVSGSSSTETCFLDVLIGLALDDIGLVFVCIKICSIWSAVHILPVAFYNAGYLLDGPVINDTMIRNQYVSELIRLP